MSTVNLPTQMKQKKKNTSIHNDGHEFSKTTVYQPPWWVTSPPPQPPPLYHHLTDCLYKQPLKRSYSFVSPMHGINFAKFITTSIASLSSSTGSEVFLGLEIKSVRLYACWLNMYLFKTGSALYTVIKNKAKFGYMWNTMKSDLEEVKSCCKVTRTKMSEWMRTLYTV